MADSARTVSISSGDGVAASLLVASFGLPGTTNPTMLTLDGNFRVVGGTLQAINGTPLTAPSIPGSGSTYWCVQVNTSSGVATIKTSSSSYPTADAGNVVVAQQQLQSTDTSVAQAALGFSTVDMW